MKLTINTRLTQASLLAAALAFGSAASHAQTQAASVAQLIDSLGAATQAGATDDWTAQRQAEADVARKIRELIVATPHAQELTAADPQGQTPLIRAALRGYAQVVDALLLDASVKGAIDAKAHDGLSAWMAAQFARPLTLAACHPQVLIREAVGLWGANLRRISYFAQQSPLPFDRIRTALASAGAKPDLDEAKRYWLEQCPGRDPALTAKIAASEDLLDTLMADSNPRLQAFLKEIQDLPKPRPPRQLPDQPQFPERKPTPPREQPPAAASRESMTCAQMPRPDVGAIGALEWSGNVLFKVVAEVQDSVPVAAAITVLSSRPAVPPEVAMFFRAAVYRTLGTYRCAGDHLFHQEFQFDYR
ncbi:hypothetical protein [Roseateles sp.]|uniref:hypothetical protein n=1 Tax=Roseateles sp. TaxID=1971397 RepID=UPI003BABC779